MGHLFCFDAKTGRVLWKKDPVDDLDIRVPIWGVAAAPLVDGDLLILQVGGNDGACVVALDKRTGKRVWTALDDPASYSSPIIIEQAGHRVLVCWTGTRVVGLNPADGKLHWQYPFKFRRWQDAVISPLVHNNRLFISAFSEGSLLLKLKQDELDVEKLWRRRGRNEKDTDALHCMMSGPYMTDDHIYGVDSYGQMRCLEAAGGDRVWEDLTLASQVRWGTLHMVRHEDKHWLFNDRGELIIGRFSPSGFKEISRAKLIKPTRKQLSRGEGVTWTHPAFAYKHVFIRNDEELVCADLGAR